MYIYVYYIIIYTVNIYIYLQYIYIQYIYMDVLLFLRLVAIKNQPNVGKHTIHGWYG